VLNLYPTILKLINRFHQADIALNEVEKAQARLCISRMLTTGAGWPQQAHALLRVFCDIADTPQVLPGLRGGLVPSRAAAGLDRLTQVRQPLKLCERSWRAVSGLSEHWPARADAGPGRDCQLPDALVDLRSQTSMPAAARRLQNDMIMTSAAVEFPNEPGNRIAYGAFFLTSSYPDPRNVQTAAACTRQFRIELAQPLNNLLHTGAAPAWLQREVSSPGRHPRL